MTVTDPQGALTPGTLRDVAKPRKVMRSFRVVLQEWDKAMKRADEDDEDLSEALRRFVKDYGDRKDQER